MTQFSDIVVTPVYGPLQHKFPNIVKLNRPALLSGKTPNPQQFGYTDGTNNFASARNEYVRVTPNPLPYRDPNVLEYNTCINPHFSNSNIFRYPFQRPTPQNSIIGDKFGAPATLVYAKKQKTNFQPYSASIRTAEIKRNAIGQSSYKQGLPDDANLGYKNFNANDSRDALRRARSSGYRAPPKIGSVHNRSLTNGQVCAWGSIPRSTY